MMCINKYKFPKIPSLIFSVHIHVTLEGVLIIEVSLFFRKVLIREVPLYIYYFNHRLS